MEMRDVMHRLIRAETLSDVAHVRSFAPRVGLRRNAGIVGPGAIVTLEWVRRCVGYAKS
jgi:hypothetical protein